jgi:hypothetical protein
MMTLLAARLDRTGNILVNTRLDHYPAFFYIEPDAVDSCLQLPTVNAMQSLALLESHWKQLEPALEALVRRHGQDFIVTPEMLKR